MRKAQQKEKPVSRNSLTTKKKKTKTKKQPTIAALKRKVQTYFNAYIRKRDSKDGVFTCIVCKKELPIDQMSAGHFFGVRKYGWMRFNELNVHGECVSDNTFNHESLIYYTLNLPGKIGQEAFNKLVEESKERKPEFTREELEKLKQYYKNK